MVKTWITCAVMLTFAFSGTASAEPPYQDNFDSYAADSNIIGQGNWKDWAGGTTNLAEGGFVRNTPSHSAPNSFQLGKAGGYVDSVWQFSPPLITGFWSFTAMTYVPSTSITNVVDLNIMSAFPAPYQYIGAYQLNLGAGVAKHVEGGTPEPLVRDQWVEIKIDLDVDTRQAQMYYDGQLLSDFTWTTVAALAAVDIWCAADTPPVYFDNLALEPPEPPEPDLPGDANDNGFVDDTDLAILLGNWEQDPVIIATWGMGNFTEGSLGDTDVDDADLAVLLGNWTGPPPPAGAAIPEPAMMSLLALGGLRLLRRRRRA